MHACYSEFLKYLLANRFYKNDLSCSDYSTQHIKLHLFSYLELAIPLVANILFVHLWRDLPRETTQRLN
jgi:hypothetical protein